MIASESGKSESGRAARVRATIARGFGHFEDVVYVGLGLLLAYACTALLVTSAIALWESVRTGAPIGGIVALLDRGLLILMIVELLYTVQVSFTSHSLLPEPFLVVGLIAATRRILVVTAEFSRAAAGKPDPEAFRDAMVEVGLLTAMVLALVISLRLLRASPTGETKA